MLDEDVYLVSRIIDEQGFASVVARTAVDALARADEIELVTEHGQQAVVRKEKTMILLGGIFGKRNTTGDLKVEELRTDKVRLEVEEQSHGGHVNGCVKEIRRRPPLR